MSNRLHWKNPRQIDVTLPFVYVVRIVDCNGAEYTYVGKARGQSRLNEYVRNIDKILRGVARGKKQRYRAVHLALAKACEFGWDYEIYPLEATTTEELNARERHHIAELRCNLNGAGTWSVEHYQELSLRDLGL